jgi:translation initiation factor 2 gamma subunit (eIF-2gamma)
VDSQPTPPTFQTTEDLIAHEISDLDEFILSLDEVDRAKLEQEAEYKKQKEHFAELELQAESEHQKVLTERAHAEKMKAYLEAESK